ncbi:MAG: hypothetical protein KAI24_17690 [Planctomycetes bacterium]|nr:hypothetical protein [Planctomycetota bacterium]
MKTHSLLVGALLLGTIAAQEPTDPVTKAPSAAERVQELKDLQQKAVDEWRESVQKAREAKGNKATAMRMRPDYGPIATKALAYAKDYAGKDEAIEFLLMVVGLDRDQARPAIETLIKDHLHSPKLAPMGQMIPYFDRMVSDEFAAKAIDKLVTSKCADVRGWATFAKHQSTIKEADLDGEAYQQARKDLLAVADAVDEQLARQIKGAIDEREKFGIGCTAPDIEGVDLDGVAFKLSDYKGKVIFLDFWGDW